MPKPVLSDSLFNANDVATAILDFAELSVTNQDFAVSDKSSLLSYAGGFQTFDSTISNQLYTFNGFAFISFFGYNASSGISNTTNCGQITDTNFAPNSDTVLPSISYQGDAPALAVIKTNGDIELRSNNNLGDAQFYFCINGWFRYN